MCPVMTAWAARVCREFDAVFSLEPCDVLFGEPNRDLDRNRHAIVGEHEALERLMTQLIVADRRNYQRGRSGRRVLFAIDDDARYVRECGTRL